MGNRYRLGGEYFIIRQIALTDRPGGSRGRLYVAFGGLFRMRSDTLERHQCLKPKTYDDLGSVPSTSRCVAGCCRQLDKKALMGRLKDALRIDGKSNILGK